MIHGVTSIDGTRYSTYLEDFWACAGGISVVKVVGRQMPDLINSGLIISIIAFDGIDGRSRGKREGGEEPASKYQIQPGYGE